MQRTRQAPARLIAIPIAIVATAALLAGSAAATAAAIPAPPLASAAGSAPSRNVQAPVAAASAGILLSKAQATYQSMIQTRYQHTFVIQPAKGTYYWDCVGFVDWALRQATPQAESAMRTTMKIRPGYVPTPTQLAAYLTGSPSTAWQQISSVTQLSGGEIMVIPGAFTSGSSTYAGHAVVIGGPALPLSDGSYAVFVYDSTALPGHGAFDSRLTDSRALPLQGSTARFSGLGYGTMRLTVDANGAPVAAYWSAGTAKPLPSTVVLARPLN